MGLMPPNHQLPWGKVRCVASPISQYKSVWVANWCGVFFSCRKCKIIFDFPWVYIFWKTQASMACCTFVGYATLGWSKYLYQAERPAIDCGCGRFWCGHQRRWLRGAAKHSLGVTEGISDTLLACLWCEERCWAGQLVDLGHAASVAQGQREW